MLLPAGNLEFSTLVLMDLLTSWSPTPFSSWMNVSGSVLPDAPVAMIVAGSVPVKISLTPVNVGHNNLLEALGEVLY